MAIVTNNDLTLGLRGRVGRYLVFRTFGGKTIASHTPRKPDPRKQTDAQRKTRTTFREAAAWAVQTLQDPEQRRYFTQRARDTGLTNAYTAAVQERMRCARGLNEDRAPAEENCVINEKLKSTSVVSPQASSHSKKSAFSSHQRTLWIPASTASRAPVVNPTRTSPVGVNSLRKIGTRPP